MKVASWILYAAVSVSTSLFIETACAQAGIRSPDVFVQSFYDWYTPLSFEKRSLPAVEIALDKKANSFSPELYTALRDDVVARHKDPQHIVGLDFDPFLNSQDPCEAYQVGDVTHKGKDYMVSVFGTCDGKKHPQQDVVVELVVQNAQWSIVNFHYPARANLGPQDLLKVLKLLKQDREKVQMKNKTEKGTLPFISSHEE